MSSRPAYTIIRDSSRKPTTNQVHNQSFLSGSVWFLSLFLGKRRGLDYLLTKLNSKGFKGEGTRFSLEEQKSLPRHDHPTRVLWRWDGSRPEEQSCAQQWTTVEAAQTRFLMWQSTLHFSAGLLRHSLEDQLDRPPGTSEVTQMESPAVR